MKIRILLCKVRISWLPGPQSGHRWSKPQCDIWRCTHNLSAHEAINALFPPQLTPHRNRTIQETSRGCSGGWGRGRSQGGCGYGHGHGGRGCLGVAAKHTTPNMKCQQFNIKVCEGLRQNSTTETHNNYRLAWAWGSLSSTMKATLLLLTGKQVQLGWQSFPFPSQARELPEHNGEVFCLVWLLFRPREMQQLSHTTC